MISTPREDGDQLFNGLTVADLAQGPYCLHPRILRRIVKCHNQWFVIGAFGAASLALPAAGAAEGPRYGFSKHGEIDVHLKPVQAMGRSTAAASFFKSAISF